MAKKASKTINDDNAMEKTCIHCGERVNADEKICPSCGLSVDNNEDSDDNSSSNANDNSKTTSNKSMQSSKLVFICIGILAVVAIVIAILKGPNLFNTKNTIEESKLVLEDIKSKLNINVVEPEKVDKDKVDYTMEGDEVVKVSYSKVVDEQNNVVMHFVMRIAKSTEDIERSIGLSDSKGNDVVFPSTTPILMTVKCDDGTEVPVESFVALDENGAEMKYMRSTWYDNDNYYSMVTDDLNTREEFLQEVNRVIIANHEKF